ncbi:MAG: radical SAM protein [Deltaproteobacteria bacterium]|nr:radical SAM protein [Deltaproteobacteria bacterium]
MSEILVFSGRIFRLLTSRRKLINLLLVKVSSLLRLERNLGMPVHLFIEPTGNCNYLCVKCGRFRKDYMDDGAVNDNKSLPLDHFRKIIDEIGDKLVSVRLWHYGEPLFNDEIFEMVEYAGRKKIITALSSNLSLLTREKAEKMVRSGLDYLIVSFDGASERSYRRHHGVDGYRRVVEAIKTLVEAKRKMKSRLPFIEMQFIVMKGNEEELRKFSDLAGDIGADKRTYLKLDTNDVNLERFGLNAYDDILPSKEAYRHNMERLTRIGFCRLPWEESVIRYSGLALPCVSDLGQTHSFGYIFRDGIYTGFKRIWNNERYRAFRRSISKNLNSVDICQNCAQRDNNVGDQIEEIFPD